MANTNSTVIPGINNLTYEPNKTDNFENSIRKKIASEALNEIDGLTKLLLNELVRLEPESTFDNELSALKGVAIRLSTLGSLAFSAIFDENNNIQNMTRKLGYEVQHGG